MAYRIFIGLIFNLLISLSCWADVIEFKPSQPSRHVVVKGDTLWDISAKFLKDPWQWPNVWRHNGQIKDPHLIYPGDVITLCFIDDKPMLCVNSNDERILYPHMRPEDTGDAIAMIPLEAIAPYLSSPKVVTKDELENAPYIIDFAGEHLIAGAGTKVYVRSILKPDYLAYTTYRPGKTFQDPDTDEVLGYEAIYVADNIILNLGDPATLRIIDADREVRRGDRLMPTSEDTGSFNFFPTPPSKQINGTIISVLNGVQELGQYDVIALNKGEKDGLKKGHILSIIQKGKLVPDPFHINKNELVKLPDEEAGIVLVFRTFERVSYALIMHTSRNIRIFDLVQTPEK
ncbi:MAG: LysM peptidoglycan-binding domain-containing protein [Methyloprofundus sp.]|nr:LysM peptidoglycan-binding domain-containing protein [Methyloprofundus sp.]